MGQDRFKLSDLILKNSDIFAICARPFSLLHNLRLLQSDANQISRKDGPGITLQQQMLLTTRHLPRISFFQLRSPASFKNRDNLPLFAGILYGGDFLFLFFCPPFFLFAFLKSGKNDLIRTPRDVAGKIW